MVLIQKAEGLWSTEKQVVLHQKPRESVIVSMEIEGASELLMIAVTSLLVQQGDPASFV